MSKYQTLYPDLRMYMEKLDKPKRERYIDMEAAFRDSLTDKQQKKYQKILDHIYDEWQAYEETAYELGQRDMMMEMLEFKRFSEVEADADA